MCHIKIRGDRLFTEGELLTLKAMTQSGVRQQSPISSQKKLIGFLKGDDDEQKTEQNNRAVQQAHYIRLSFMQLVQFIYQ